MRGLKGECEIEVKGGCERRRGMWDNKRRVRKVKMGLNRERGERIIEKEK